MDVPSIPLCSYCSKSIGLVTLVQDPCILCGNVLTNINNEINNRIRDIFSATPFENIENVKLHIMPAIGYSVSRVFLRTLVQNNLALLPIFSETPNLCKYLVVPKHSNSYNIIQKVEQPITEIDFESDIANKLSQTIKDKEIISKKIDIPPTQEQQCLNEITSFVKVDETDTMNTNITSNNSDNVTKQTYYATKRRFDDIDESVNITDDMFFNLKQVRRDIRPVIVDSIDWSLIPGTRKLYTENEYGNLRPDFDVHMELQLLHPQMSIILDRIQRFFQLQEKENGRVYHTNSPTQNTVNRFAKKTFSEYVLWIQESKREVELFSSIRPAKFKLHIWRQPIYIIGAYTKFSRKISQSDWSPFGKSRSTTNENSSGDSCPLELVKRPPKTLPSKIPALETNSSTLNTNNDTNNLVEASDIESIESPQNNITNNDILINDPITKRENSKYTIEQNEKNPKLNIDNAAIHTISYKNSNILNNDEVITQTNITGCDFMDSRKLERENVQNISLLKVIEEISKKLCSEYNIRWLEPIKAIQRFKDYQKKKVLPSTARIYTGDLPESGVSVWNDTEVTKMKLIKLSFTEVNIPNLITHFKSNEITKFTESVKHAIETKLQESEQKKSVSINSSEDKSNISNSLNLTTNQIITNTIYSDDITKESYKNIDECNIELCDKIYLDEPSIGSNPNCNKNDSEDIIDDLNEENLNNIIDQKCYSLNRSLHMSSMQDATESIESHISPIIKELFGGDIGFHAEGREDVDVRMLISPGRPFGLEIRNPIRKYGNLVDVMKQVNQTELLRIANLRFGCSKDFSGLQSQAENHGKYYCAVIITNKDILPNSLLALENLGKIDIKQKTPVRVVHRRSLLIRPRYVAELKPIYVNSRCFLLTLYAEAGTYIKEFVTGDFGRTVPSLGTLLGNDVTVDIVQLDVLSIV